MELIGREQRGERGRALAQEYRGSEGYRTAGNGLLKRLQDNERALRRAHRVFVEDLTEKKNITPVVEWLVDNFYVIEEQISLAKRHLPSRYLLELPCLETPGHRGVPIIYDLAEHIIAYGDSRVDAEDISVIVTAYQEIAPLKLGELWAIPIMLRLALLENIRRLAGLAVVCREERELAGRLADGLIRVEAEDPKNLIVAIADMARAHPRLSGTFVTEFKRRLQGRGSAMKLPLQWIEQNLEGQERTIDRVVDGENHVQAMHEVSIRNCITSLRGLNAIDWKEFVETMSLVERTLRRDPADVYGRMDFSSRDYYRRMVEDLARKSDRDEVGIAGVCLDLAREAAERKGAAEPEAHVGHYLVSDGLRELCGRIGCRKGVIRSGRGESYRLPTLLYFGAIAASTVAFTGAGVVVARAGGLSGGWLAALTPFLAVIACHFAVGLANFFATRLVTPRFMPRMDFRKEIPSEHRTLVVVPTLMMDEKGVGRMLRGIETQFLNNRGRNVHFGLLTDFADADTGETPDDEPLLNQCRLGVGALNDKYPGEGGDNFFLFHRPRIWNAVEGKWMGRERKRGKLEDLNRFLVDGNSEAFSHIEGATRTLANVRYVITLDADTILPRESAWQMAGAMAHPLNRPRYDAERGRVVAGHGILQPRVDATLSGANRTRYAGMSVAEAGLDPYTRASSDVYQDLFDEGSFVGKGIYDAALFNSALGGRFPDNKILSHDLLEGCVLRSGLLNDIKLYEDPPRSYLMDIARRHRWIRGDWQIAGFMFAGEAKDRESGKTTRLSFLSRWKVFDNLRRSVTPVALFVGFAVALLLSRSPVPFLVLLACLFPVGVAAAGFWSLVRKPHDCSLRQHVRKILADMRRQVVEAVFNLACLPFEACVAVDAIVRSLWRQLVSRRNLLQWNPSDNSRRESDIRLGPVLRRMWVCPLAGAGLSALAAGVNPGLLPYAAPLSLLWLVAPAFVGWLSKPLVPELEVLSEKRRRFLHRCARRTWSFFEHFVTVEDNWLPPDNYQEFPGNKVAHRTSPTNIGLSLLANLSAWDFGYISGGALLRRGGQTLATMGRMERHNGHFLNWYDTRTLEVLRPAYVSTVDSGNLAAHLLVFAQGLRDLAGAPILDARVFSGLLDTLELAEEEEEGSDAAERLRPLRDEVASRIATPPLTPAAFHAALKGLERLAARTGDKEGGGDSRWLRPFADQVNGALEELDDLLPWAAAMDGRPEWAAIEMAGVVPTLRDLAYMETRLAGKEAEASAPPPEELRAHFAAGGEQAADRLEILQHLVALCEEMADIEYDFLYDSSKHLLSIGFNVDEHRRDSSFYDLLASEARLAVYLGIAQNKLAQDSWFALGRLLTLPGRRPLLVSWSGSMFEYLMPLLVMPAHDGSFLDETYKLCVETQREYTRSRNIPWGISESGYYQFDSTHNYQYRAFGVPELGLRHALAGDLVIAPYAAAMATMVYPETAAANLERMDALGFLADYGFYEAVDYTASRLPRDKTHAVVRSFMAHHQGMSLVSLGQALLGRPMHRRFSANPLLRSTELLLQETIPSEKAVYHHSTSSPELRPETDGEGAPARLIDNPDAWHPEVQLLSNGNYHVMVSSAGGGYSRWQNIALTRWREDATRDNWGTFFYFRDSESGAVFSNTRQPIHGRMSSFEAIFSEGKAEFNRRDISFDCHTEIVVSPEDDVEVRRLRIGNRSAAVRTLDVVSYAEIVLNDVAADDSHQAFSKLFVQTRIVPDRQAIVCERRPRDAGKERFPLAFHMLAVRGNEGGAVSYETDRLRFLGRGRDASRPDGVFSDRPLSGTEGAVLDPVAAIRTKVVIEPGAAVVIDCIAGVAPDAGAMDGLLEKYQDERMTDKAFTLAQTHGQLFLRQMNISEAEARRYARLAGSVVYANQAFRTEPGIVMRNRKGQSALWGYAISGDLPIVLLKIEDAERFQLVVQMIQAHDYWRRKGLRADLVIWNEDRSGYLQDLHDRIVGLAGSMMREADLEKPGGIFVRSSERIPEEDRILLQASARVVMSDADGMLEDQLRRIAKLETASSPTLVHIRRQASRCDDTKPPPVEPLVMDNGYGGFTRDGREYVIVVDAERGTPLPWINVLANEKFGCVVSEAGAGCTWGVNAHQFRLTPWSNDPVSDTAGEALYIRDERTGHFWSPTPGPCGRGKRHVIRHGFGYSSFLRRECDIESLLTVHVDRDEPVKFHTLRLTNHSRERRSLSVTAYVEWILGDLKGRTGLHVVTGVDSRSGALFARNHYNDEFRDFTAFLDVDDPGRSVTGDRREFLGRNGSPADPLAMRRPELSGRVGAGLDPCGATRMTFTLGPGQSREVIVRLGVAPDVDEARRLIGAFRGVEAARASLERNAAFWRETLGTIQVETPDPAFNFMANGWLLYQTLACRFWGRAATYQSGGAFGFRDQLQDSMALVYAAPRLAREHLLRSAERQFAEGDVQHWWHPPGGRGVRTRCSDDYLWLPFTAERYVTVTGDAGVLDEEVRFISGRALRDGEESSYDLPVETQDKATLYEHCRRAIRHGLRFGAHGLPLMGSGDWNDGMDRVGIEGRGESVWLGFFLFSVLRSFAAVARGRGDAVFAEECLERAETLAGNLERHAWDGEWYRRAYFDDGTPLGSSSNHECRIDSIAQSWAALTGAGGRERALQAMRSLDDLLVDREHRLIRLFAPPFATTEVNPGYIKGYVPGVRENGGQYTHAAIWAGMAFAGLGDRDRAWEMQAIINPANHGNSRAAADTYMVEPYVVAADVYANPQHQGRGGWSWYTGSAAWLYRFMLESLLGFTKTGDVVRVAPCVPALWPGFRIRFRYGEGVYDIDVTAAKGKEGGDGTLAVGAAGGDGGNGSDSGDGGDGGDAGGGNGGRSGGASIRLSPDPGEHRVEITL